jgi:hypothetical protein
VLLFPHYPIVIMFDIIDPDIFADVVHEHFSVLDRRYVEDQCKELYPHLQATFDSAFETRFIIINSKTGLPLNVNAVLTSYEAAETFRKIVGELDYEIGYLLINR